MGDLFRWFLTIELLALAVLPLVSVLFPWARDGGAGLAKSLGPLAIAYVLWCLSCLGLVESSRTAALTIAIAFFLLSSVVVRRKWRSWRRYFAGIGSHYITVQTLYFCVVGLFLLIRMYQPEIHWGEKPMEFAFFNYFSRLESLPPEDPWAAGSVMQYYYFGFYMFGLVNKIGAVQPNYAFNFAVATIPALFTCALFSVLLRLIQSTFYSVLGSLCIAGLGNLEIVRLVLVEQKPLNSHTFWAATRLFTSPSFSEFPLWSFLFADLHPHVMALPFTVCTLAIGVSLLNSSHAGALSLLRRCIGYGVMLGIVFLLNSWDAIAYGVLAGMLLLFQHSAPHPKPRFFLPRFFFMRGLQLVVIGLVSFLAISPGFVLGRSLKRINYGFAPARELNTLSQVFSMHGAWLVVVLIAILVLFFKREHRTKLWQSALVLFAFLSPFVFAYLSHLNGTTQIPWGTMVVSGLLLGAGVFVRQRSFGLHHAQLASVLIATAGLSLCLVELCFIIDRMNTVFKFHYVIWNFLGIAAVLLLPDALRSFRKVSGDHFAYALTRKALVSSSVVFLMLGITGTLLCVYIVAGTRLHWSIQGERPTLDGTQYLKKHFPGESAVIDWINDNVEGVPTLVEAVGKSYRRYTRITNNTGVRALLGWEYHVSQRGTPWPEIRKRKRDIMTIYRTLSGRHAYELLKRHNVSLFVVGELERKRYPGPGLMKFDRHPNLFHRILESNGVALYSPAYAVSTLNGSESR